MVDLEYGVLLPFSDAEDVSVAEIIPPPVAKHRVPWTPELGQRIADRLGDGETLRQICRDPTMPSERTVRRWVMTEGHPFAPLYDAARRVGYHSMADEMVEIADDGSNDWLERETRSGAVVRMVDTEAVLRSRLRVATRQWLLSKALPKIYGTQPAGGEGGTRGDPFVGTLKAISDGSARVVMDRARVQAEDAEMLEA